MLLAGTPAVPASCKVISPSAVLAGVSHSLRRVNDPVRRERRALLPSHINLY